MIRLGVFGGTFAPFHNGHRKALKAFLTAVKPDLCLVIPSGIPPHKQKTAQFTDEERLEMTRLACKGLPNTEVCDWEIRQNGKSYTCKTLEWIEETYPDAEPILYVGSDMFLTLQDWYCPQKIFDRAQIAVFSRTGNDFEELQRHGIRLTEQFENVRYAVFKTPPFPISSTEIREKRNRGEDVSDLLPPSVAQYLAELQNRDFYDFLKTRLSEKRLRHSVGIMKEAETLAKIHGANPRKAAIAGLLHDMTKEFSEEEHFRLFEKHSYPLDELLRSNKDLWHAASAFLDLKDTLGITDPEIRSAIRYHTTGKADMTLLETILFTADAIEPNRTYADADFYRTLAREDLRKAAYLIMRWTVEDLKRRNVPCHGDMIEGCAFLEKQYPNVTAESEKKRLNYPLKGL